MTTSAKGTSTAPTVSNEWGRDPVSIARANRAKQRAESTRCPKCGRGSAVKIVVHEGQVVAYCRWDDCDYENGTMTA